MKLTDLLAKFGYKIQGGCQYGWFSYGKDAWLIDMENDVTFVYDHNTLEVYEIDVWSEEREKSIMWINPNYRSRLFKEAEARRFSIAVIDTVSDIEAMLRLVEQALAGADLNLDLCDKG